MMNLNWMSVLIAAVAAWMFGAAYYTLLGPRWIAAQGKTMEQCKAEQAGKSKAIFYLPFVLSFVGAVFIAGALCWFGFVLTTLTVNNAYTGRKWTLTAIDAAHWLGALIIIGAIVGYFGP